MSQQLATPDGWIEWTQPDGTVIDKVHIGDDFAKYVEGRLGPDKAPYAEARKYWDMPVNFSFNLPPVRSSVSMVALLDCCLYQVPEAMHRLFPISASTKKGLILPTQSCKQSSCDVIDQMMELALAMGLPTLDIELGRISEVCANWW